MKRTKYRVVSKFPDALADDDFMYLGAFTWTYRNAKVKLIDKGTAVRLDVGRVSPTEYARTYLMLKYGGRPKATSNQIAKTSIHRAAPMVALPGRYQDMVYVDLQAAYWSILKIVGWDVDYNPGSWWGIGQGMEDFPLPNNKLVRNMLVSVATVGNIMVADYGTLKRVDYGNPLLNSSLWACVQDILHMIANFAVNNGAVYVHTDGYIIPRRMWEHMAAWLDQFGLTIRLKHEGDAIVWGGGRYQFHDSRQLEEREKHGGTVMNINPVDDEWIVPRLRTFAKARASGI